MDVNLLKAKELFLKYEGSHFYMSRDGEYENYKKYQVTKEQEKEWINEYQMELIQKLDKQDLPKQIRTFCTTVRAFLEISNLQKMVSKLKSIEQALDSYSRFLISKEILETLDYVVKNSANDFTNPDMQSVKLYAIDSLQDLTQKPITVASIYTNKYGTFGDTFSEDTILKKVIGLLEKYKD